MKDKIIFLLNILFTAICGYSIYLNTRIDFEGSDCLIRASNQQIILHAKHKYDAIKSRILLTYYLDEKGKPCKHAILVYKTQTGNTCCFDWSGSYILNDLSLNDDQALLTARKIIKSNLKLIGAAWEDKLIWCYVPKSNLRLSINLKEKK